MTEVGFCIAWIIIARPKLNFISNGFNANILVFVSFIYVYSFYCGTEWSYLTMTTQPHIQVDDNL